MKSKIALVTGGSRGLGKSMALKLAGKGVDVILTYNSKKDEALAVVAEIEKLGQKAHALQLDVSTTKGFGTFTDELKTSLKEKWQSDRFDFLVNNAGIGSNSLVEQTTEEQFDLLMNIHFKSVYFLTQKLIPLINDNGRIINISSGLTRISLPGYAAYASMKGAIEVLTRYLAVELGPRGITVNTVAPGATATDFNGGRVRDNDQMNKHIASTVALGRVGVADDIGGAVASLLDEGSGWVNAQRIEVSGGQAL